MLFVPFLLASMSCPVPHPTAFHVRACVRACGQLIALHHIAHRTAPRSQLAVVGSGRCAAHVWRGARAAVGASQSAAGRAAPARAYIPRRARAGHTPRSVLRARPVPALACSRVPTDTRTRSTLHYTSDVTIQPARCKMIICLSGFVIAGLVMQLYLCRITLTTSVAQRAQVRLRHEIAGSILASRKNKYLYDIKIR